MVIVTIGDAELLWGINDGISDPIDVGVVVLRVTEGDSVGESVAVGTIAVDGGRVSIGAAVVEGAMAGWFVFGEEGVGCVEETGEVPIGDFVALLGVRDGKSDGMRVVVVTEGVCVSTVGCIVGADGRILSLGPAIGESVGETGEVPSGEFVALFGLRDGKSDGMRVSLVSEEGKGVCAPTVGCIVGPDGRIVPLGPAIGESVGADGGILAFGARSGKMVGENVGIVALGTKMGEAVGPSDGIAALGPEIGISVGAVDGMIALGIDIGETVGVDGELILGSIVGILGPNSDGSMVWSMNGAILEGDGEIDDKFGGIDGRILATGDNIGALLGMPGKALPSARIESRMYTIPLQPSIFEAKTVALLNLTGSIVTVTELPGSNVSRSPATMLSSKCNPGST